MQETLQDLMQRLEIPANFDLLLVGDGSGSRWGWPVGWGCVALERNSFERKLFWGGLNDGTVIVAELMAYLAPLSWYASKMDAHRKLHGPVTRHIHIITDNEHAGQRGQEKGSVTAIKNSLLWGAFALFERQGLCLHWHWIPRETAALNVYVDALSKLARKTMLEAPLAQKLAEEGLDVSRFNPWE